MHLLLMYLSSQLHFSGLSKLHSVDNPSRLKKILESLAIKSASVRLPTFVKSIKGRFDRAVTSHRETH